MLETDAPSRSSSRKAPAACTIIARNYLSHARILARSYLTHEPDGRFYLAVVDGLPEGVEIEANIQLVQPEELGFRNFGKLCFKYDVTELATSVKPSLLLTLLERYGEEELLYLDPDILIMNTLDRLKVALRDANIILTPHILQPLPLDGQRPGERHILLAGAYNLGFVAVRKSHETERFLRWWQTRLEEGCRVDTANGLFVDQKWIDLVPGLFDGATIFRDVTYNVAYWNLHARTIERTGDGYLVNGRPIAFFHFSGFDPSNPLELSRHQDRVAVVPGTPLADLLAMYSRLHIEHGFLESSRWAYGYGRFDNGMEVHPLLRRVYLGLDKEERYKFGDPFHVNGASSFLSWATSIEQERETLSPFLKQIYRSRQDIAARFPDIAGRDRGKFIRWAQTDGAHELGYSPSLIKMENPRTSHGAEKSKPASEARLIDSHPTGKGWHLPGVNVAGYLTNESGVGAAARGYIQALRSLPIPVTLRDLAELSVNRSEDLSLGDLDTDHPYPVNLLCVNADQHFRVRSYLGEEFFRDRYNIGVWFWELPHFPEQWHDRFPYYDEIWAASSFIANILAPLSPAPIVRIPPMLTFERDGSRSRGRERLAIFPDEVVYLFVFDFHSYFARKNPLAVIEAFKQAFAPSDPVRLVIKCVNEDFSPADFATLTARAENYPISIHAGYWRAREMKDLMAACDVYVSLHRSEGLGLTMMEAMSLAKPVIATAWSGNMDFMSVNNSFPVRYRLVELEENVGPYEAGALWAEPCVEHAAELMRYVFENRDEVVERARIGRQDMEAKYSEAAIAGLIEQRLSTIHL